MVDKYVILTKALIKFFFPEVGAGIVAYDAINAETQAQTGKSAFTHIKEFLSIPEKYTPDEYGYMFH